MEADVTASEVMQTGTRTRRKGYPVADRRYDLAVALAILLFVCGLFLDGWAHNHGKVDNTFFTVWHAAMYGAFGLVGMLLAGGQFYYVNQGYAWSKALPDGYFPALVGVALFGLGGAADLVWHETFGIEENIQALLSPSHLLLGVAAFLFVSAPLMHAWRQRTPASGWWALLPLLLSVTALLSLMTFFTQYASISTVMRVMIGVRPADSYFADLRGISATILYTVQFVGLLLMMLRRWRLPFGAITLILTINGVLMIWLAVQGNNDYRYGVPAWILSGLLIDTLIWWLKPSAKNLTALRIVTALAPFIIVLVYMAALHLQGMVVRMGIWWEIHMWLGVPVLGGLVGLLLSLVAFPPALAPDAEIG
jgi:hypothetical protein